MASESTAARVERALEEARSARAAGEAARALTTLDGAQAWAEGGPLRRDLRVALRRERGLAAVAAQRPDEARDALALGVEQAGVEAALADPVRAELAMVELMAGRPRRAEAVLAERGRDRRASLVALARVRLWAGETAVATQALQASEQAPGATSDLSPPPAVLRAFAAIWDERPAQARMLIDGVGSRDNPYWEIARLLMYRSLWVESGDLRYLSLGSAAAELLRFDAGRHDLPGLAAIAASQHAAMLSLSGQTFLAKQAAEEALGALGPLTLPEWPRWAVLHDLALVYRDAGRGARWEEVSELLADTPGPQWPGRMVLVTGPRALGVALAGTATRGGDDADPIPDLALALLEAEGEPWRPLLTHLAERCGARGARWLSREGDILARVGTALVDAEGGGELTLSLANGDRVELDEALEQRVARLDLTALDRVVGAARRLTRSRRRAVEFEQAVELAVARREEAERALERTRRGAVSRVLGGRYPAVAGRSAAMARVLDRLAALGTTRVPVVLEGEVGTGRRHLTRAFAADQGTPPERGLVLDASLLPRETMVSTLARVRDEAAGGVWAVANAEHLTGEAASWLLGQPAGARYVLTLNAQDRGPVAERLRDALAPGLTRVPRLDERVEDLPDLIDAIAEALGRRPAAVGVGARAVLARRAWPGHVGQLHRVIGEALVRAAGKTATAEDLEAGAGGAATASLSEGLELGYHEGLDAYRHRLLLHALEVTGGNRTKAAALLGIQRTYFMRLIRNLDGVPPAPRA